MADSRTVVLVLFATVIAPGCDRLRKIAAGTDAGAEAGATVAVSAPPPVAPACIAGKWDAKDLSGRIKSAIKSAANAGLTPGGGKIVYDFSAPSADGKGVVTVTVAEAFVNKLALSQGPVQVSGTVTLSGTTKSAYTLGPQDALTIDRPTEGKINAHADVRTSGIVSTRKTEDSPVDLSGTFIHECSPEKLQMWGRSNVGKQGTPLTFARMK